MRKKERKRKTKQEQKEKGKRKKEGRKKKDNANVSDYCRGIAETRTLRWQVYASLPIHNAEIKGEKEGERKKMG